MNIKAALVLLLSIALHACDNGDGDNCASDSSETVDISGTITYDFIPHNADGSLNYGDVRAQPLRGVTVEFLNSGNTVVARSQTDSQGEYRTPVPRNNRVRLRVTAELLTTGTPAWQIRVTDNTSGNALYAMQGDLVCSGNSAGARDLHASAGWTGASYGAQRIAAPFAILDSVYEALQLLLTADPNIVLPALELRWSVDNKAIPGNNAIGNIGTSNYDGNTIHILGDEDNDTDEYDRAVVQHEFAHYLEDRISRSDSIGGPHALDSLSDMRLAFSEGFANAFTAIAAATGYYEDSVGAAQGGGFRFSLESNAAGNFGWFSENSSGQIVYDIFDASNEADDGLSLGFAPIYQALVSDDFRLGNARTSIYAFASALKSQVGANPAAAIDDLLRAQQIFGTDAYGTGETNDGGSAITLPLYRQLSLGAAVNVCSDETGGAYNGFDVRRFLRLTIAADGNYTLSAVKTSGSGARDPDLIVWQNENYIADLQSAAVDLETGDVALTSGNYVIEFYDYNNVDGGLPGGRSCFDVSIN